MTATVTHRWSFSPHTREQTQLCLSPHFTLARDPPTMNVWKPNEDVQKTCCQPFSLTVKSLHLNISQSFTDWADVSTSVKLCVLYCSVEAKQNSHCQYGNALNNRNHHHHKKVGLLKQFNKNMCLTCWCLNWRRAFIYFFFIAQPQNESYSKADGHFLFDGHKYSGRLSWLHCSSLPLGPQERKWEKYNFTSGSFRLKCWRQQTEQWSFSYEAKSVLIKPKYETSNALSKVYYCTCAKSNFHLKIKKWQFYFYLF